MRHALSGKPEDTSVLGLCRDLQRQLTFRGWYLDFTPEYRCRQWYRDGGMQIIPVTFKNCVRHYRYFQVKVTAGTTAVTGLSFAGDAYS